MMLNEQEHAAGVADTISAVLPGEEILYSNSLATITTGCLVLRNCDGRSRTILSHLWISEIKMVKRSHLALLAISNGLFVIAAAALYSKEGGGAGIPAAFVGLMLLIGYWGSQRASVAFVVGSETIQTIDGTVAEAATIIAQLELAQLPAGTRGKAVPPGRPDFLRA